MKERKTYRFELLPGNRANLRECPRCGKRRFRPYLDTRTGEVLERFGRCNRVESCGFTEFPHHLLENSTPHLPAPPPLPPPPRVQGVFWDWGCYTALDRSGRLSSWLLERFGKEVLEETHRRYLLGSLEVGGRTFEVFWHLSLPNNLHTAALIEMRREGDRLKRTGTQTWLHALPDWREAAPKVWTQTLFGLNQLTLFRGKEQLTKPLRIVEGYRTAIVCSIYFPEFVWLAASSVQGLKQYNYRTLEPLKAFTLELFPDAGEEAEKVWSEDAKELRSRGFKVELNSSLLNAFNAYKARGEEVGDLEDCLLAADLQTFRARLSRRGRGVRTESRVFP